MDAIVKQKIDKYVNNAFTGAHLKANEAAQIETANAQVFDLDSHFLAGLLSNVIDFFLIAT
jgi:hypothetical protein